MSKPLMPMATAVWLVDNTSLTFRQIGRFCELHVLEVQAIADETVGQHMVGQDPTIIGQLTKEEIERCQKDPAAELQIVEDEVPAQLRTKGPRYTPVSKRQDKPDTIAWLLRHHSEMSDAQIGRLIGTTKPTIEAIRSRSHWNIQNIQPRDPVSLGLCSQRELDDAVRKAHLKLAKAAKSVKAAKPADEAPAEETVETPAEEPVAESDDAAVEAPAEETIDTPAEEPAETPAEEPAETPAEEPVAESDDGAVEAPAEETVETPAEETVETPAEEPVAESDDAAVEAPAEETIDTPAEETIDTPAEETIVESTEEAAESQGDDEDPIKV